MERRTAIVTGVTGQDGSYLAELLALKGYQVFGLVRRTSSNDYGCLKEVEQRLQEKIEVVEGDVTDLPSLQRLCKLARADEFYNMAAQSHVGTSFQEPQHTAQVTGLGVLNCLEAIRHSGYHTRFLQASTSELFGNAGEQVITLDTPFHPRSPYGCAKLYGYWITVNYREAYKMYTVNSVAFNHESPRRGPQFVTRKIVIAAVRIKLGIQKEKLRLGNLDACRDWGSAQDYVHQMWLMLQQAQPRDYLLATGESHSVREFCQRVFKHLGLDYQQHVEIDPALYRPAEVYHLLGNPAETNRLLGIEPKADGLNHLIEEMVSAEMKKQRDPQSVVNGT